MTKYLVGLTFLCFMGPAYAADLKHIHCHVPHLPWAQFSVDIQATGGQGGPLSMKVATEDNNTNPFATHADFGDYVSAPDQKFPLGTFSGGVSPFLFQRTYSYTGTITIISELTPDSGVYKATWTEQYLSAAGGWGREYRDVICEMEEKHSIR